MHVNLGGYHVRDIEFVAAFDVVKGKVGVDLAEAMWAHPNNTIKFADVAEDGRQRLARHDARRHRQVPLAGRREGARARPPTSSGSSRSARSTSSSTTCRSAREMATKWYAEQILDAGCAMVNCMPVFIAREHYWQQRFEKAGVPIIGDDIKSQVGATITHRVLTCLFRERGVHLDKTMQLNVGGNSDFLNMLERERLESKKISKTNAVTSMLDYDIGEGNVHVGPSDYVPWLTDRKWAYIRMEGSSFGDVPLNVELKLEVWDSPNSAGIVIDAVRLAKLALNNGVAGALEGPSAYLMKSPPKQIVDDEAYELSEAFIEQNRARRHRRKQPAIRSLPSAPAAATRTARLPARRGRRMPALVSFVRAYLPRDALRVVAAARRERARRRRRRRRCARAGTTVTVLAPVHARRRPARRPPGAAPGRRRRAR